MLESDKFHWVGSIETFGGHVVNVLDIKPEMIHFDDIIQSLSLICRYNGHVPHFYSVGEHSVRVAGWLMGNDASPKMCLTGLLHDAAEAYVGDMVRPLKRTQEIGGAHQQLEERVTEVIMQKFGGLYPYPDIVHEADEKIYRWEVANIRTGDKKGWTPEETRDKFMSTYNYLAK